MTTAQLQFKADAHRYSVDGRELPSVTQVLADVGLSDTTAPWFTEWHRDRGTAIHAACEILGTPDQGDLDWDALDDSIVGYVRAWQAFMRESKATVLEVERKLWSPEYWFAGQVDFTLGWQVLRTVVDIKTGQPAPWHCLQTAAYQILDGKAVERVAVYLRADGTFRVRVHPMKDGARDRARFLAALATYNAKRGAA